MKPGRVRRLVTLWDVASEASVSVATASRALSRPQGLKPNTVKRVREVAQKLGYRPNRIAQALRLGASNAIYVVVPSLSQCLLEIYGGIEAAAHEFGYSVIIRHTNNDPERENEHFSEAASGRADGVLLLSPSRLSARPGMLPPTVAVLERAPGHDCPAIRIDNVESARKAARYLVELGHRRIFHIAGDMRVPLAASRRDGFLAAMRDAGLPADESCWMAGGFSLEAGQSVTEGVLMRSEPPTAIFAVNDEVALGAILAIRGAGLRVPEDVSVIGHGDHWLGRNFDLPVSTMHVPAYEMGYRAMATLRRLIQKEPCEADVVLPTKVVPRATTAPLARAATGRQPAARKRRKQGTLKK